MGRWSPRDLPGTNRLTDLHVEVDELDEEPPALYYLAQAAAAEQQLEYATDPNLRARLERDVAAWRIAAARATIDTHWDTGDGDRPLF